MTILNGGSVMQNSPPKATAGAKVTLNGNLNGNHTNFGISDDHLSKHILLVGGTGCGKTTLFYHFVNQIKRTLTADDVMIIFDSKGDFHSKFFSKGDIVIGNSAQYRASSAVWSIYEEIVADGLTEIAVGLNCREICKAFFADRVERNSSNPFFPNAARDVLESIIIALVRNGKSPTNRELYEYLTENAPDGLLKLLQSHSDLASVATYISGKSGQSQGVLSELYSVMRDIFTGVFADDGNFSVRKFARRKGGKALFIEYDLSIGNVLAPVYTVLCDLALKEVLGRTASKGNVYLIVDEMKLLPNLQHFEDGINFGRSLGLKIMAGLQSIDQLNAVYSDEAKARNIIAGFSSIFSFRSNDPNTREYVTRLFGQNMVHEQYQGADGSYRDEKRIGNTVEDWNLLSLEVGEAIVGLPFEPPFRFHFDMYK